MVFALSYQRAFAHNYEGGCVYSCSASPSPTVYPKIRTMQVCFPLGSRHSRHHYKVEAGNALSNTIAEGALQVTDNETNNFQHMLFRKNCSISISCAMWGSVACKHKARQGLHQPAGRVAGQPAKGPRIGGEPPPPSPPPWSLSLLRCAVRQNMVIPTFDSFFNTCVNLVDKVAGWEGFTHFTQPFLAFKHALILLKTGGSLPDSKIQVSKPEPTTPEKERKRRKLITNSS